MLQPCEFDVVIGVQSNRPLCADETRNLGKRYGSAFRPTSSGAGRLPRARPMAAQLKRSVRDALLRNLWSARHAHRGNAYQKGIGLGPVF